MAAVTHYDGLLQAFLLPGWEGGVNGHVTLKWLFSVRKSLKKEPSRATLVWCVLPGNSTLRDLVSLSERVENFKKWYTGAGQMAHLAMHRIPNLIPRNLMIKPERTAQTYMYVYRSNRFCFFREPRLIKSHMKISSTGSPTFHGPVKTLLPAALIILLGSQGQERVSSISSTHPVLSPPFLPTQHFPSPKDPTRA